MKKIGFIAALLLAVALGRFSSVHAQISSPSYVCPTGNGGQNSGYPCAQYLLEIVPQRLGGGYFIYQIQDNAIDLSTLNAPLITTGAINGGASIQVFQPNSSTNTSTIAISAP